MPNSRPHVLTTYSGRQLDLDDCTSDAIFIEDIAAALSKMTYSRRPCDHDHTAGHVVSLMSCTSRRAGYAD